MPTPCVLFLLVVSVLFTAPVKLQGQFLPHGLQPLRDSAVVVDGRLHRQGFRQPGLRLRQTIQLHERLNYAKGVRQVEPRRCDEKQARVNEPLPGQGKRVCTTESWDTNENRALTSFLSVLVVLQRFLKRRLQSSRG
jgi:hypothetical protein